MLGIQSGMLSASDVAPPPWTLHGDATLIPFRRGVLAFIRYTSSNVGAYDELLWLSPFRASPAGRAHHVSPIYVSSEASMRSGRANWGLPKELATFRLSPARGGLERVEVTHDGRLVTAFERRRPRAVLPLDLGKLPRRTRRIVQLWQGRCFETIPDGRGRLQLTRVSQLEINGDLLPDARSSPSRVGIFLSELELRFPAAALRESATLGAAG